MRVYKNKIKFRVDFMKKKFVLGCMLVAVVGMTGLMGCGGEEEVKKEVGKETLQEADKKEGDAKAKKGENPAGEFSKEAQDKIVAEAQVILDSYSYKKIAVAEFITTNEDYIKELQNKDLCHITEVGQDSPSEFYYDYKSKELYHINQGFWFVVTDDYRNVTPDIAGMKEMGDEAREAFKREKK
jgi:hypothetical protein